MWVAFLLLVFVTALAASPLYASDTAVEKYKNYTPEQMRSLSDDERQKKVPLMYIWAAQKGLASDAKQAMAVDLNVLMYPGVGDYLSAIKMFQKDIGDAATGILTVSQIHKLGIRADYQRLAPISFPTTFFQPLYAGLRYRVRYHQNSGRSHRVAGEQPNHKLLPK